MQMIEQSNPSPSLSIKAPIKSPKVTKEPFHHAEQYQALIEPTVGPYSALHAPDLKSTLNYRTLTSRACDNTRRIPIKAPKPQPQTLI